MVRETRSPTTFQFYISTIIMMEFKAVVGDPVPFQFYISTIIMKKTDYGKALADSYFNST